MTQAEYKKIFDEAFAAAKKATNEYLAKYPDNWYPCGFAWVRFPSAKSRDVNMFKKLYSDRGHKGYPSGWAIWDPSDNMTQCMEAKYQGAVAFADVCNKHGVECMAESRMD